MPPTYADLVRQDGASAYWRLDEVSGTVARDQIGGVAGAIAASVVLGQPGALGDGNRAMRFTGVGEVAAATGAYCAWGTGPASIECWFKATTPPAQDTYLVDAKQNGTNLAGLNLAVNASSLYLTAADGTAAIQPIYAVAVADGRWHHVVGLVERGTAVDTARLYVDGVQRASAVFPRGGTLTSAAGCTIGTYSTDLSGNSAFHFVGSIDEVALYKTALTPAQVAAHYVAGFLDPREVILRNKSGHALLGYDEASATLSRLAASTGVAGPAVEPVCWNKSGDPVLGYLEPTDALVVLAGGGLAPAPAVLAPRTYDALIRRDGPSNYWRLDEATGLLARDSVGGKDGTISGGVTLNQPGAMLDSNTAMRFDGATGKVVTAANVSMLTPFTLELWVRSSLLAAQPLFSTRNGAADSGNFVLITDATGLLYLYQTGNGGTSQTAKSIADGRWHHVALVVTNTATPVFYIDSMVSIAGALPGAFGTGTATHLAEIGADSGGPGFWNGLLDEVAIYPVALTPAQVAAHYAAAFGLFPTVEPVLRSKSGHAVLGYNEATDQLSVLCQGTL